MNGKLKWIIIIAIVIVILVVAGLLIINEMQYHYTIEEIKEYNYFVLTEGGKYGVVDKSGNIVIEPEYIAVQIPNPSKPIFICISSYNDETDDYETVVYNEKKETLLSEFSNVQAIPIDTNIETNPYEKSNLIYKQDGKYGIINIDGKVITKPIYDEITSINYKEGTFIVVENGLAGVINMNGKVIIKSEYETIISDNYYNEATNNKQAGFIVRKKTEDGYRYGYISYRGKTILKPEYTELERVNQVPSENDYYFIAFKNGQAGLLKNKKVIINFEYEDIQYHSVNNIFVVQRNGKQGLVTVEGQEILKPEYNNISFGGIYLNAIQGEEIIVFDLQGNKIENDIVSMSQTDNPNYYIAIDKNGTYKVVDKNGETIIDDDYTYIEYLPGNYFIVAKDGKNGIINSSGEIVVNLIYTSIFRFNDSNLLQAEIIQNNSIELYNMKMEKVASMEQAIIKQVEPSAINPKKYILLASESDFAYYDIDGNKLESKDVFPENLLYSKMVKGKWGFVDKSGDVKVAVEYDMVTDFNEYGFAGIKKDGKWGVIDQSGKIVQEPIYEIDWISPSFLGKYYQVNSWYGDSRFSSDAITNS